jgi:hypothetical protein
MSWTLYPVEQFASLASQWDALVRTRPGAPFLEAAFLQPLLDTFGRGSEHLCLHHTDGRLTTAAIMQPGPKGMWQTFQPSQLPLGAWVTDGCCDLVSACRSLVPQLPGLALGVGITQQDVRLQLRPDDGPWLRTQDYIQTAWIDLASDFDAYWETRGKNLKQNTRKQHHKLQTQGTEVRLECITAPQDVPKAIGDYGLLESAGWKTADGTAIHPGNAQGRFYQKMLENFCNLGRGRIYRYCFDDTVVAMDLCIDDGTVIVVLKTTYDENYKTLSPSTLMRQVEFKQIFDEKKYQRIEFYGKVMEWHTRWTSQSRSIYHANVYRWALLKTLKTRTTATASEGSQ